MFKREESFAVLPQKFGGGPHGLGIYSSVLKNSGLSSILLFSGEPDDRTLRKVEREVLIPKIMREKAKVEKCFDEVHAFESCCKDYSLLMVVTCRKQNDVLKNCLAK